MSRVPVYRESGASFSPCGRYRWSLWREWDAPTCNCCRPFVGGEHAPECDWHGSGAGVVMFVGLNPSTADGTTDDPTIRRCATFARDWGYDGMVMCNLFAFISTDPRELVRQEAERSLETIGQHNDQELREQARHAALVVAAWGAFPEARERAQAVVDSGALGNFTVLGLTKGGHPRHPLYLRADCKPLHPLKLRAVAVPAESAARPLPPAVPSETA